MRVCGLAGLLRSPNPPTATQSEALAQATWLRPLFADGLGLGTMAQPEPFQRSTRVRAPSVLPGGVRLPPAPTATQSEAAGQAIPSSPSAAGPHGLRLFPLSHAAMYEPAGQAVPSSPSVGGPGGLGLFTIDQADPFQCSTRVRTGGGPVVGCGTMRVELPTAVQSETPEQETPDRPTVRCA